MGYMSRNETVLIKKCLQNLTFSFIAFICIHFEQNDRLCRWK